MTGTTDRIISELRRSGGDPRGWFEPVARGGWVYLADYSFVTSEERGHIIRVIEDERD